MVEPVAPPVAPPAEPPVEPSVYFGSDGSLVDGWQGTLDESLREEKSLSTFKTVSDLAKSFVNTKSMVGKNTMEIPTDASSEVVWDLFYKAGGKPDTVADYNLKAPDGFPEEVMEKVFPKARLEAWQERFFKAGISKKAASQFIADFAQDMLADLQSVKQVEELEKSELVSGLAIDWGAAFEQKKHLGNIAMEEAASVIKNGVSVVNEEFKARLVQKAGNDPDIIRAFANLGAKFAEGKPPNFANIPTPADLQTQIDEIMANPLYMNGTQKERMRLAEQVMALRTKMKPEKTT
jgi:hypothetical protein